ncbi:Copper Transporter integral membrane protein that functions in high affinity copper transport [Diatrype stigma]|uniref:Copper transport protein n=1 Tax=Diatrype stigma TaxID=117547 RepID=A0AAN9UNX3_9PEZI
MLWNWNTVDACFLSSTWQIRSAGMFAGSCIGVILLTMSLEFLRRLVKEYDRYLVRKHADVKSPPASSGNDEGDDTGKSPSASTTTTVAARCAPRPKGFRPSVLEQAVRALLHMVQFAVAYFIMLLAMYYNGYFIICIFIGAYIGSFIFQWETLGTRAPKRIVNICIMAVG